MDMHGLRVGYVPYAPSFAPPGDRRRFVHYAQQRGLRFEIADPDQHYDVVVLSERADLSVWSRFRGGRLVYDLIDSYLAIPRQDLKGLLRGTAKFIARQSRYPQLNYREAVRGMCRCAEAVICTTEEQRRNIAPCCSNVHIILDSHSMLASRAKINYGAGTPFRLVWEGMPQNLGALQSLGRALCRVHRRMPIVLHVVTDSAFPRVLGRYWRTETRNLLAEFGFPVVMHEWREDRLAEVLTGCDMAIIPLDLEDPFSAGKPENKLLLFWRMGMPTLVSATPAYCRAMANAGVPMACANDAEWEERILRYGGDEALRRWAGERGRTFAETTHSEARLLEQWDAVFQSLA
jgi:glycosyltransferase involved in cell wall biosynthesis